MALISFLTAAQLRLYHICIYDFTKVIGKLMYASYIRIDVLQKVIYMPYDYIYIVYDLYTIYPSYAFYTHIYIHPISAPYTTITGPHATRNVICIL